MRVIASLLLICSSALAQAPVVGPQAVGGGSGGSGTVNNCATAGAVAVYSATGTVVGCLSGMTTDSSGNLVATSVTLGGTVPTKSGAIDLNGITSGQVWVAAADIAGTPIVYILPSANGTAGQFLIDQGSSTCPTLPSSAPVVCHPTAWVSALPNGTTATTQSQSDNSTKVATTAYVDAAASGAKCSVTTAGSGAIPLLFPAGASSGISLVSNTTLTTSTQVYLWAITPDCNFTIRHVGIPAVTVPAASTLAGAFMSASGTTATKIANSDFVLAGPTSPGATQDIVLTAPISLLAGVKYMLALTSNSASTVVGSSVVNVNGEAAYNSGSNLLIAKCSTLSGGTSVPASCTMVDNAGDVIVPFILSKP